MPFIRPISAKQLVREDEMSAENIFMIATFTVPERIGTTPQSLLWLLPLAMAVTVVYKTTILPTITSGNFIKKVLATFSFGVILLALLAVGLCALGWLITEWWT